MTKKLVISVTLELRAYVQAIISTKEMIERDKKVRYVSYFKNHGKRSWSLSTTLAHTNNRKFIDPSKQ